MIWISGVWDGRMKHKVIAFAGLLGLFLIAYAASVASGSPFFMRFIF